MTQPLGLLLLTLYTLSMWLLGWLIIKKWFKRLPSLLILCGGFFIGVGLGVPLTYVLSCVFTKTGMPILWGAGVTIGILIACCCLLAPTVSFGKKTDSRWTFSDICILIFSLTFGFWVMFKTFHAGSGGQLFVGSNNIFDFGFSVGLMRSISWGANIPVRSPFFAGLPLFYHYFFNFWTAVWDYFGVPAVWAINIPSIFSFAGLLIIIYYFPQIVAKQKPVVGWIAVILTITNSSMTFWQLVIKNGLSTHFIRGLWRLPTYPFAGPFDGSTISIFITLNNYVNQRHLAFAIAIALFIIMIVITEVEKKRWSRVHSLLAGCMTGIILLWNMEVYLMLGAMIASFLLLGKQWKFFVQYIAVSALVGFLLLLPIIGYLFKALLFLRALETIPVALKLQTWNIIGYLWENLGLIPFVAAAGFWILPKSVKKYFTPFAILFMFECVLAAIGKRGFEQKIYSFQIIGVNILAATAVGWIWQRKKTYLKIGSFVLFAVLTISGIIDLIPIKNEFAYPLVGKDLIPVITWISRNTPRNSVFVSYEDMIDPVVLAGRMNYDGFFHNVGDYDRTPVVRQIYLGNNQASKSEHISYVLVPRWAKSDFPYSVNNKKLSETSGIVFQDNKFIIYGL